MKIAVTGATGFLGRYLVAHLAARGAPAPLLVPPDQRPRSLSCDLAKGLDHLD